VPLSIWIAVPDTHDSEGGPGRDVVVDVKRNFLAKATTMKEAIVSAALESGEREESESMTTVLVDMLVKRIWTDCKVVD
jgi:hypothetical protein